MYNVEYNSISERELLIEAAAQEGHYAFIENCVDDDSGSIMFATPEEGRAYLRQVEPSLEEKVELKLAQNTTETLELMAALNELQKLEQAQSNAELIELMLSLQGGM